MKKITFLLFFVSYFSISQTIHKTVASSILQQTRELQVSLPEGYDENIDKSYPIILVLDADYLFEPVVGNVHYYTYMDKMPKSIVIGINQADFRKWDTAYGATTSFPTSESADFYDFIKKEVLPHIKNKYRTTGFSIIIGDGRTANFINYFLLKDLNLFDAYVNLSPDYAPKMEGMIANRLSSIDAGLWYYAATGINDFEPIKKSVHLLEDKLGKLDSITKKKLHLYIDYFKGNDHLSTVAYAIPAALEKIFLTYGPILPKEYVEKMLQADSYFTYLLNKYTSIEALYDVDLKIRTNDIMAIAAAIEKKEKWEEYAELAKIAGKNYPETMYEDYFEARFYEETGEPKNALNSYQKAYLKNEVSFLTKDMVWEKINQLKVDFGY